jgi:hypothetical protein
MRGGQLGSRERSPDQTADARSTGVHSPHRQGPRRPGLSAPSTCGTTWYGPPHHRGDLFVGRPAGELAAPTETVVADPDGDLVQLIEPGRPGELQPQQNAVVRADGAGHGKARGELDVPAVPLDTAEAD